MNYKQTIVLAALIGLLPACEDQINEPEKDSNQSGISTSIYGASADATPMDAFMKHVPNIENIRFYQPREDTHYIHFSTANGDVNKMTKERDVAQTSTDILYPLNFTRTDNQSVNGTAHFVSEPTWTYTVSYKTPNNETRTWSIEDMTLADYSTFSNFSPAQMSSVAKNFILSRNSAETAHADSVWSNIYFGRSGAFTQNTPTTAQFSSMGAQQHLTHSDFGTITYTIRCYHRNKSVFRGKYGRRNNNQYFGLSCNIHEYNRLCDCAKNWSQC